MAATVIEVPEFVFDTEAEISATFALTMTGKHHPELCTRFAKARLKLATVIKRVNEHLGQLGWVADTLLQDAMREHAQAMADLLRGESSE